MNPTVLSLCSGMMVKVWSGEVKWKRGRSRKRGKGEKGRKEERKWKQGRMPWKIRMQGNSIDNENSKMVMVITCPIRQLAMINCLREDHFSLTIKRMCF